MLEEHGNVTLSVDIMYINFMMTKSRACDFSTEEMSKKVKRQQL